MSAELPYAGTSGFSGSDTSRERMERQDADGSLHWRQQQILDYLRRRKAVGVTVKELREDGTTFGSLGHHGQVSAALTHLHMTGRIVRLKQRRDRCEVYVLPEWAWDRELSPYRPNKKIDRAALVTLRDQCDTAATLWVRDRLDRILGER